MIPTSTLPVINLRPKRQDLCLYRGDTIPLRVDVVDGAGVPVDVSAATWDADIRTTSTDPVVIAGFEVVPVVGVPSAVSLTLTADDSALLPEHSVWDLEMTISGVVTSLLYGDITTMLDVSREPS